MEKRRRDTLSATARSASDPGDCHIAEKHQREMDVAARIRRPATGRVQLAAGLIQRAPHLGVRPQGEKQPRCLFSPDLQPCISRHTACAAIPSPRPV